MFKKLLLSLLALLVFTSCSNSGGQENKSNKFVVGMECNYAPFNWLQNEKNELGVYIENAHGTCMGYDVTIAKELAKAMNKEVEIKAITWEGLIPALQSDSIDAIIAGMSYTAERAKEVDFTKPYYESDYVMLVLNSSKYANAKTLKDFEKANIVGQMGTNYDTIIDQIDNVNHQPALNSYPLIVNAIKSGSADGAPAEKPTAQAIIKANPELKMIEFDEGKGFTQTEDVTTAVSIAVKKGNTELMNAIDKALSSFDQNKRDEWMKQAISLQKGE